MRVFTFLLVQYINYHCQLVLEPRKLAAHALNHKSEEGVENLYCTMSLTQGVGVENEPF